MAKKIIPVSEVKVGDTIRNTFVVADITVRREGIVAVVGMNGNDLRSKRDYSLGPSSGTIQLLDRPKPAKPAKPAKPVPALPTGVGAIVRYTVDFDSKSPVRTAFRSKSGAWVCYNDKGVEQDRHFSDEDFIEFLTESSFPSEVIFVGVTK